MISRKIKNILFALYPAELISRQDLLSCMGMGYCKCLQKHGDDMTNAQIVAYCKNEINLHIYREHREKILKRELSAPPKKKDTGTSFEEMIELLNEQDKEIFRYRFKHDMSLREIAKLVDLNYQRVHERLNRGLKRLGLEHDD